MDHYSESLILELGHGEGARFSDLQSIVQNPRTLSRKLAALKHLGLLESRDGVYHLTQRGRRAVGALDELRKVLGEASEASTYKVPHPFYGPVLERYVRILQEHFGPRLLGVLLFGSVARGGWTLDSDIDLLVVVEGWEGPAWKRIRELWPLRLRLMETEEYLRVESRGFTPVLHHYPLSGQEAVEPHRVYWDASLEGRVLFEKDGFLSGLMARMRGMLAEQGAYKVTLPGGGRYWVLEGGEPVGA